jgi:hypothetical protein
MLPFGIGMDMTYSLEENAITLGDSDSDHTVIFSHLPNGFNIDAGRIGKLRLSIDYSFDFKVNIYDGDNRDSYIYTEIANEMTKFMNREIMDGLIWDYIYVLNFLIKQLNRVDDYIDNRVADIISN